MRSRSADWSLAWLLAYHPPWENCPSSIALRTLTARLTHLPDLRHAKLPVFLLTQAEAHLAHAQLPAQVDHRRTALSLAQRVVDLLFRKSSVNRLPLMLLVSSGGKPQSQLGPTPNRPEFVDDVRGTSDPLRQHPSAPSASRHENPRYGVCFSGLT